MPIAIGLGVVIVAIAALLVMYAYWQLFHPVLDRMSSLPVIGGVLQATGILNLMADAYSAASGWADQAVFILGNVIYYPIRYIADTMQNSVWAHYATRDALLRLQAQGLARYWSAVTYTNQQVTYLEMVINNVYQASEAYALTLYWQAITYVNQQVGYLETVINNVYQASQAYALTLYWQAVTYTNQQVGYLETVINNVYQSAVGEATTLYWQAITYVNQQETYTRQLAQDQVQALEQTVTDQLGRVQAHDAAQLAAEAATLGGAIALVQTAVQAIQDAPCMQECDTLGQLGADLSQLSDLAFVGALIAWVGESVKDPQGAASQVESVFGGMAHDAAQLVETAAGVL